MEAVFLSHKAKMDEREKYLNEMMENGRETNERTAFLLRQTLGAEIEAARLQIEKTRQCEVENERYCNFWVISFFLGISFIS